MATSLFELGRSIKRIQNRHHRQLDARLAEIGGSLAQWDALRAISLNPDVTSHVLAELTFQTDQSFGALATRLVEKGLITREPGKGRALRHRLTAEGKIMLKRGAAMAEEMLTASFAPLSEKERDQLASLIRRLLPEAEPGKAPSL
jgi:DNA-binding MarR family transcriptional regulator